MDAIVSSQKTSRHTSLIKQLVSLIQTKFARGFADKLNTNLLQYNLSITDNNAFSQSFSKQFTALISELTEEKLSLLFRIKDVTGDNSLFKVYFEHTGAIEKFKATLSRIAQDIEPRLPEAIEITIAEETTTHILHSVKSSNVTPPTSEKAATTLEVFWHGQGQSDHANESSYGLITIKMGDHEIDFAPPKDNAEQPVKLTKLNKTTNIFKINKLSTLQSLSMKAYWDQPYENKSLGFMRPDGSIKFEQRIKRSERYVDFKVDAPLELGKAYQLTIINDNDRLTTQLTYKNNSAHSHDDDEDLNRTLCARR